MKTQLPIIKDCSDCGACCTGQAALPVHLVGKDYRIEPVTPLPQELADELRATIDRLMKEGFPPDGSPCIWYDADTKKCRHYEHRPILCRDQVLPGDKACRKWRRSLGIDPVTRYRLKKGRVVKS